METVGLTEAAHRAGEAGIPTTTSTISDWCERQPALGWKVVGRWRVRPELLDRVLRGTPLDELESS